jgi:signal peptidase I
MPAVEELDVVAEEIAPAVPQSQASKAGDSAAEIIASWLRTAIATIVLFLLTVTFIVQGFRVEGSCMEPNLVTGERILGSKLIYRFKAPARGDVVVFKYPKDPRQTFVKRVIGMPGETIEIRDGMVFIDGERLSEPYVINSPHGSYGPEVIRPGNLFVMGDYRDMSNDSRRWGELPIKDIKARGWIRYWPPSHTGLLR